MRLITFLLIFFSYQLNAQIDTVSVSEQDFEIIEGMTEPHEIGKDDKTYVYVKQMPEFPGGNLELRRYIAMNVDYPFKARKNGIEGVVYVRFEVRKDGSIGKVEVQKGVHEILDNESIRVVRSLPNFKPGRNENGETVNVWYSIPITFRLN